MINALRKQLTRRQHLTHRSVDSTTIFKRSCRFYSTSHSDVAATHIRRILDSSIHFNPRTHQLVVIHDKECQLSQILFDSYQKAVSETESLVPPINIEFQENKIEEIKQVITTQLKPGDLVVLIQTGAFYLNEYRIRLELFERELKTIEHVHLGQMSSDQYGTYIDMLSFDHREHNRLARSLKNLLESSQRFVVESGGRNGGESATLVYETPMEPAKLNMGDYSEMKTVGGTFPVGEVFTEPQQLSAINGEVMCFGFPNLKRQVEIHKQPFKLKIENGVVTDISDAPDSFKEVYEIIRANEGEVIIREFGIGLNPGASIDKPLNDVTAFERQKGLHFSLGKKHTVYKKAGLKAKRTRFHIDIFVDVRQIKMDETIAYENGDFLI